MILVTVGTTMPFPSLLEEVDRLAGRGVFGEDVLCQTGHSRVTLTNCAGFAFRPTLDDLFEKASLVITHGGTTVFTLLSLRKPFIAFANPLGADDHQLNMLAALARMAGISWSADVRDLERLYRQVSRDPPAPLSAPRLGDDLLSFIARSRS